MAESKWDPIARKTPCMAGHVASLAGDRIIAQELPVVLHAHALMAGSGTAVDPVGALDTLCAVAS